MGRVRIFIDTTERSRYEVMTRMIFFEGQEELPHALFAYCMLFLWPHSYLAIRVYVGMKPLLP
jgi:hypothetical protein